jgi:hypothetical protein
MERVGNSVILQHNMIVATYTFHFLTKQYYLCIVATYTSIILTDHKYAQYDAYK